MNLKIDTIKNIENLYDLKSKLSQMKTNVRNINFEIMAEETKLNSILQYDGCILSDRTVKKTILEPTDTEAGKKVIEKYICKISDNASTAKQYFQKIKDANVEVEGQIDILSKKLDEAINSNELASDYEKAVESGLADGMSFLDYTISKAEKQAPSEFTFTEADIEILKQYVTSDEYRAQNGDFDGISQQNLQWWTDDVSSFKRDPNGLGTTSYVINQQNAGMGFIPAEAYLAILANHAETTPEEDIQKEKFAYYKKKIESQKYDNEESTVHWRNGELHGGSSGKLGDSNSDGQTSNSDTYKSGDMLTEWNNKINEHKTFELPSGYSIIDKNGNSITIPDGQTVRFSYNDTKKCYEMKTIHYVPSDIFDAARYQIAQKNKFYHLPTYQPIFDGDKLDISQNLTIVKNK